MKKLLVFIFSTMAVLFAILFFAFLNFKLSFDSAAKVKNLAADSGFYDFTTSYIRDEVVNNSNIEINDDAAFAKLNEAINTKKVTTAVNTGIDNFFAVVNNKDAAASFPIEIKDNSDGVNYNFKKNADFTNNPLVIVLQQSTNILLILAACSLILLLFAILLTKSAAKRFRLTAGAIIFLSATLVAIIISLSEVLPNYVNSFVAKTAIVTDGRLVNAISKLLNTAVNHQILSYSIEILALITIAAICLMLSKVEGKKKLDGIGDKI